jgi:hypothetical protein
LVADDELRGRGRAESRAKPELRLRTRSPPPPLKEEAAEGVVSDLLALLPAFCAAAGGQPKVGGFC